MDKPVSVDFMLSEEALQKAIDSAQLMYSKCASRNEADAFARWNELAKAQVERAKIMVVNEEQ